MDTKFESSIKLIRQPYAITMARHNLNIHEFRILTRIIEGLQPKMMYGRHRAFVQRTILGDVVLQIPTNKLLVDGSENYSMVKKAIKSLQERIITIAGRDDSNGQYEVNVGVIMRSKYYLNNTMVEIQLDRDLVPELLALAHNYSQYLLDVVFSSSSTYVARLYMFFSHWRDKTKKTVMLSELRQWLNLQDKYSNNKDFKKYVLDPASKELKSRADVWFEIDKSIKEKRTIVGYVVNIYKKYKNPEQENSTKEHVIYMLEELFELSKRQIKQLVPILEKPELLPHIYEKIQEIYRYISNGKVRHVQAYVIKSIQNEFEVTVNEEEKQEEEKQHVL